MSEEESITPEGFQQVDMGSGYGKEFGAIYKNTRDENTLLGFRVADNHLNHTGFCHGGALAFFADMQLTAVIHQASCNSKHYPTKNIDINYFAPVALGDWVEMHVDLVRQTKTALFTHGVVRVNGRVVGESSGSYHVN